MAFTYGGTNGLSWLLTSTVFDNDVLVWPGPCLLLVATCLEDALVGKDEVPSVLNDLVDSISKLNTHLSILSVQLVFLLRLILGLDLLVLVAIELQNPTQMLRLDNSVWKLAVEQLSSLGEAEMGLRTHRVRIEEVVQLLLLHSNKGDSFGSVQLGRVKLWWLDAFPLDGSRLFLLVEVLPHHPLDLLEWQVQQPSDDAHRDDRL